MRSIPERGRLIPSRWDNIKMTYPGDMFLIRETGETVKSARCRVRCEAVNRVADARTQVARDLCAIELKKDLEERFRYWRPLPLSRSELRKAWIVSRIGLPIVVLVLFCFAPIVFSAGMLKESGWSGGGIAFVIGSCVVTLLMLFAVSMNAAAGDVCSYRFAGRWCVSCKHDLAEVPSGIDPALIGGIHVGPRRCPNCNVDWPLVPPPGVVYSPPN